MKAYYTGNIPQTIPTGKVAIVLYTDYREYGGPEEGGWYYTDPIICNVHVFNSLRKARVFMRQYTREVEDVQAEYNARCGDRTFPQRVVMEFPGRNDAERDSDGTLISTRPYHLRSTNRSRELLYRPHYC